ncbi:uncharacterized protein HMPREF1120_00767 [Exophiala dermatitidis NIH/UT8656]|uniref:F-box domain-containing protein n=1 Tax=Exophiala dermatitidis (strain ATCC 34100 / CBS 525.76 / NIH/UT8656) TaxID=858893 RepID=H6BKC2_EXODN|nr:uncharacterized protein HMPREF1120_00767 [Exophiala dermatitidis NIH/UT8656]EHY52556.1 hypothetical protein HMPREF1120_00767 [Exophiala dermatitidis NIH/UT8656]
MNALLSLKNCISSRLRGSRSESPTPTIACQSPCPPSVQVQAGRTSTSTLVTLPAEILLCIVSFLPTSSVACLSLTSKRYREALFDQFDPEWRDNDTEKAHFLRLLEEDLPEMMVCYSCNILYRWGKSSRYLCPNRYNRHKHTLSKRGAPWCFTHEPVMIYRNMVDAFLRGFAKGSRYGPQLQELNHTCKSNVLALFPEGVCINKTIEARVVRGKLFLHSVHKLSVSLLLAQPEPSSTPISRVDLGQIVSSRLLPAIHKFTARIGCTHTPQRIPAVILYAFRLRVGCSGDRTRRLDLLSCGRCATDLRVRVELDGGGTRVQIELEIWQSFGGRDFDNRDEAEDAHFSDKPMIDEPFDINYPPVRDLEKVFKGGVEGECVGLCSPNQPRRRQSWIQLWGWHYDPIMAQLRRYSVPCNDDRMPARTQDQALPLQW